MPILSFRKKKAEAPVTPSATPPAPPPGKKRLFGFLSRKPPAGKTPCPKCGTLNPDNVNYCKDCGSPYPRMEAGMTASNGPAPAPQGGEEQKVWLERGNDCYRKGEYTRALECYTVALDIDPAYAKAWNNKALAFEKMGNTREAQACREKYSGLTAQGR